MDVFTCTDLTSGHIITARYGMQERIEQQLTNKKNVTEAAEENIRHTEKVNCKEIEVAFVGQVFALPHGAALDTLKEISQTMFNFSL